jgi:choline dehydrogenase-like flavoprotein
MHIDLDRGGPNCLDADVAVVGAGAAGLSLVRRLAAGGARVLLLESGGLDFEPRTADLNAGTNVGMDYYPLDHARLRFFGGTTAIWGGRLAAFEPIDFERRPWVTHSGWPIGMDELGRYYAEARAIFGVPEDTPAPDVMREAGVPLPDFSGRELHTPLWSFDEQFDRFSFDRNRDLADHPRVTVVTHATVREIVAFSSGRGVERLAVRSLSGHRLDVHARHFVLAAGGIENPRLMLASQGLNPDGLGNDHDQVGRYFMEHPHARGGRIVGGPAWRLLSAFAKRNIRGRKVAPLIAPSPTLQEQAGILNTSLTIAPRRAAHGSESWGMRAYLNIKHRAAPNRLGRTLWKGTKRTVGWLQQRVDPARPWLLNRLGRLDIALVVRAEQAPNPDSRVMLDRGSDAIGMPRAVLDWRTSPLDVRSVSVLVDALAREAGRLDLGKVEKAEWLDDPAALWRTDPLISAHPIGGYHHMGTTRMSTDPRRGVTDGDGTVHGVANLHIAGSSLFPTSGWANPTLTIVALALRTGDNILALLGRSPVSAETMPSRRAELVG